MEMLGEYRCIVVMGHFSKILNSKLFLEFSIVSKMLRNQSNYWSSVQQFNKTQSPLKTGFQIERDYHPLKTLSTAEFFSHSP